MEGFQVILNRGKIFLHFHTFFNLMYTIKAQLNLENLLNNNIIFFTFPHWTKLRGNSIEITFHTLIFFNYNSMYQTTVTRVTFSHVWRWLACDVLKCVLPLSTCRRWLLSEALPERGCANLVWKLSSFSHPFYSLKNATTM